MMRLRNLQQLVLCLLNSAHLRHGADSKLIFSWASSSRIAPLLQWRPAPLEPCPTPPSQPPPAGPKGTELHNTKWTSSFFLFPGPWAARGGVLVYRLFWTCGCCVRVLVWFVCLISRSVRALSCPAVCRRGSHFGWLLDFASVCHSSLLLSHGDPVKGSRMRPAPWLLTSL